MVSKTSFDNPIVNRRNNITKYIIHFFPKDISKIISNYDYHLEGKATDVTKVCPKNISCCFALPDGRIVFGLCTGKLTIWNPKNKECEITFKKHREWVSCITFVSDGHIVSGSGDTTIKIWNSQTGNCDRTLMGNGGTIYCIDVLPDNRIVSGSGYGILKIWNLQTENCDIVLDQSRFPYHCVSAFSVEGKIRIVSGSGYSLKIWNVQTGSSKISRKYDIQLLGHTQKVTCVSVLHDGLPKRIVSGSDDNAIIMWNSQTGKYDDIVVEHVGTINCIGVLPDGRIVSGSGDGTIKVWNQYSWIRETSDITLDNGSDSIICMSVLADGRIIGVSSNSVTLWS
jgi:WD40 repeat protein